MKKRNDYYILFLALGATIVFEYYVPQSINRILFFIFIYLFYKSEKDYLWIAFIFIIIESPGGLFGGGSRTEAMRMPIYSIIPKFSFTFEQIFIFTALFKAIKKKIKFNPNTFLKNNLIKLLIYFCFLVVIGIGIGFTIDTGRFIYSTIVYLTLFYSVYCLFTKESDYVNFFKMMIPMGFIAFGLQLYSVSAGHPIIKFIVPYSQRFQGSYNFDIDNVRPIESTHIIALLFFFSLYFLLHKKKYFNSNLLFALNIICFFSIIITATRGWSVTFVIFYVLNFIFLTPLIGKMIFRYVIAGFVTIIFLFSTNLFVEQLNRAVVRLSTLELFVEGDVTGGGTISRFDVRAPAVMEAFYNESTIIFGAGFSETYYKNSDSHVGFHNLLFNTGIAGAILVTIFLGSIIVNPFKISGKLCIYNPYKEVLKIFPIMIISLLIVNSGSQFYGYDVYANRIFMFVYIIYFLNNQISCALQWEERND